MRDRDPLVSLAELIRRKTTGFHPSSPSSRVVLDLLRTAFLASLRTEEGRFVRGSITFANPSKPHHDPPLLTRADYPSFTRFTKSIPLTPESLLKLSRAIDRWSGSIAVHATKRFGLVAWGVVDQLVHQNVRHNREGQDGGANPGTLTVLVDGPGELAAYRGDLFLGAIRKDRLVAREQAALSSLPLFDRILPTLMPYAHGIARALGTPDDVHAIGANLFSEWVRTVARLCISLRRTGTGGALLLTPSPKLRHLDLHHELPYSRLQDSMILSVLDSAYADRAREHLIGEEPVIPREEVTRATLGDADERDRQLEMRAAVRLAASLAAVDGLVLLSPTLSVTSFGTKIRSSRAPREVFAAESFERLGVRATRVDVSRFGTRHSSMLWYCEQDPKAIGVIVSQDGNVRVTTTVNRRLVLWDDVGLLGHKVDVRRYRHEERTGRAFRATVGLPKMRGYTKMPKTLRALLRVK